jgi:Na+/glutamate symporter
MSKTTAFLGGIIAGVIGIGVASWYFAEYRPNHSKKSEKIDWDDALTSDDTDNKVEENKTEENVTTSLSTEGQDAPKPAEA